MRDVTCADCPAVFQGFPQSRRCPKCAKAKKDEQNLTWRLNHKGYVPPVKAIRRQDHLRARVEAYGAFGTIPGTEWVASLDVGESVPALALQRVPAVRMEQWIREYLRM